MLAGKVQYSQEEKDRWERVRTQLRPGLLMRVRTGDYHEDSETPTGFMEDGDYAVLVERYDAGPIMWANTNIEAGRHIRWVTMTRWGIVHKDENYIKQLWVPAE